MKRPMPETARRIDQVVYESNLTDKAAAAKCGVSESVLRYWRIGETQMSQANMWQFCTEFDVSADWLLGLSDTKERR